MLNLNEKHFRPILQGWVAVDLPPKRFLGRGPQTRTPPALQLSVSTNPEYWSGTQASSWCLSMACGGYAVEQALVLPDGINLPAVITVDLTKISERYGSIVLRHADGLLPKPNQEVAVTHQIMIFAIALSLGSTPSAAKTLEVLHAFNGVDGSSTDGGLVRDLAGNLYGVTPNGDVTTR
jgi:hypothetical protein